MTARPRSCVSVVAGQCRRAPVAFGTCCGVKVDGLSSDWDVDSCFALLSYAILLAFAGYIALDMLTLISTRNRTRRLHTHMDG